MRIAIDIRAAAGQKTGKGFYTSSLVHALLNLDSQNEYLLYTDKPQPEFAEYPNATERLVESKGIRWHFAALKDIKKQNVDLFIAPSSYIIPALTPKELKTVMVVHDLVAFLFPQKNNKKAMIIERTTLKKASQKAYKIVTVSENTKKDLLEKFPKIKEKTEVVYPAIANTYKPIDSSLAEFKEEKNLPKQFFLFVGTLEPRKNIEAILKAHATLIDPQKKKHENPHLVVIGARGWQFSKIFQLLNELGTGEYVVFKGYTPEKELNNYYNSAIALVFPSLYEGFGLPALEAMQSACPVITSNKGSLPEVVGEAALMVDPENMQDLAKAMEKIYDDKVLKLELIGKGLEQSEKFSWQKSAKEMLKLISDSK